jgi:hypothetical protein
VQWIVRNEGRKAESINDMGHIAEIGQFACEHSADVGPHYRDCIVMSGDRVIAVGCVPVTVSGVAMPARNPTKKPE